ncbi:nucleotidyltransferase family protein [Paenibacillus caseinilyticus]|uniref:nucleotidyltransferase family protein n=1 Tax=Paenibacillus caseinilyticus TaxID=3098138 RepID=UPI0022B8D855|nr:nucleotidyltransferase domain-containing protein [Paenibacillus caseinilyticus]MCZ8519868.1 nucleotidyltransferase domain-containing protein [Paenibacillus caseinilyticus]
MSGVVLPGWAVLLFFLSEGGIMEITVSSKVGETMPLQMNDNEQAAVRDLLRRIKVEFGVKRLFLFGSRARGEAEPYSDIDLLVLTEKTKTIQDQYRLSDISADISINYGVALNCLYFNEEDWKRGELVNPQLKANIEREGIELGLQ